VDSLVNQLAWLLFSRRCKSNLPVATDLGRVSFDAANGIGTIYSPKVTMNAGEAIFDDFAVDASKDFFGFGPDGAYELVGPLKKLLEYTQSQGAKTATLKGYYASEDGAALGTGKVGEKFSFSFPATKEGLREFLKGLKSEPSKFSKQASEKPKCVWLWGLYTSQ
jgi:filamentous hemagglutinin